MFFRDYYGSRDEKWEIQDRFEVKTFFFLENTVILGAKSERRDQISFSFFLKNINFRKSLPRAPEFEYPPLMLTTKAVSDFFKSCKKVTCNSVYKRSVGKRLFFMWNYDISKTSFVVPF